jgi:hypothetical protein
LLVGLATILAIDAISDRISACSKSTYDTLHESNSAIRKMIKIRAAPDSGVFLHLDSAMLDDINRRKGLDANARMTLQAAIESQYAYSKRMRQVYAFMNIRNTLLSHASTRSCVLKFKDVDISENSGAEEHNDYKCLFAEYVLPYIRTNMILLQVICYELAINTSLCLISN